MPTIGGEVDDLRADVDAISGGSSWGGITGTLANQADLQTALDAKGTSSFSGSYGDLANIPATFPPAVHNHDLAYSALGHNHDASYSALGHDHAGVYEPANANIQAHVASAHAPSNAQKNSDILKSEIEAKLTGEISSHSHAGGGAALDAWPVGSVYIAVDSTSPATRFGGGTWSAFGAGRVLVGLDAADTDFDVAEETGGVKTVTLTGAQSGLPQHRHQMLRERSATTGGATTLIARTSDTSSTVDTAVFTENVAAADAAQAHTNVQPYITVYMWKRTA